MAQRGLGGRLTIGDISVVPGEKSTARAIPDEIHPPLELAKQYAEKNKGNS